MAKRKRLIKSIRNELVNKSREAALAAVQIFNNPNITFKSEIYVVQMVIAWTYLLHAYYRKKKIDYRYYKQLTKRKRYKRTKYGAFRYWELERCIDEKLCPIDKDVKNNLKFLISLRHEIEHQMTTRIDDYFSARFQAACLNYNEYIKILFGEKYAIDKHLSFSLQFSAVSEKQVDSLKDMKGSKSHINKFIAGFDSNLSAKEFNNPKFAYRVLFVAKTANRKGQADRVIEFVKANSKFASKVNTEYVMIKETEKKKYRPGEIVKLMKEEGFIKFNMQRHTELWKRLKGKDPAKGYGVEALSGTWGWYDRWVEEVKNYCTRNKEKFT